MILKIGLNEYKPVILGIESTIINRTENYAGTIDIWAQIDDKVYVIDNKTSQAIYETHKFQIAAYWGACIENDVKVDTAAILRLRSRHKCGYEFWEFKDKNELERYYEGFLNIKKVWEFYNPDPQPKVIDVPRVYNFGDSTTGAGR